MALVFLPARLASFGYECVRRLKSPLIKTLDDNRLSTAWRFADLVVSYTTYRTAFGESDAGVTEDPL